MTQSTFRKLSRDVDWQQASFLQHVQTFSAGQAPPHVLHAHEAVVQDILDAYQMLAERFYRQFRRELKKAHDRAEVKPEEVPLKLQTALDKLIDEWDRVYSVIAAIRASAARGATRKNVDILAPVVRAALNMAGLSPDTFPIVLQLGQTYNMRFFYYTADLMTLSLPLPAITSPWEWTVLWHEIAGQRTRLLKSAWQEFHDVIDGLFPASNNQKCHYAQVASLKQYLRPVVQRHFKPLHADQQKRQDDFLDQLSRSVLADLQGYLAGDLVLTPRSIEWNALKNRPRDGTAHLPDTAIGKFIRAEEQPLVMLSFDELLRDILDQLSAAQMRAAIKAGWSADWLEELFQDSFSVLNFPLPFLLIFKRLLDRHPDGGKGLRHPPHTVRLAVAMSLKLLDLEALRHQTKPPTTWPSWQELGVEDEQLLEAFHTHRDQFDPYRLFDQKEDKYEPHIVWQVAKQLRSLHKRMGTLADGHAAIPAASPFAQAVIKTLSQAMTSDLNEGVRSAIYEQAKRRLPKVPIDHPMFAPKTDAARLIKHLLTIGPDNTSRTFAELTDLEFGYTDFVDPNLSASFSAMTSRVCPTCGGAGTIYYYLFQGLGVCRTCNGTGQIAGGF